MNALLPVPTTRLIEKHTQDNEPELQLGFNTYDTCKEESKVKFSILKHNLMKLFMKDMKAMNAQLPLIFSSVPPRKQSQL
jgi:hypothetical protein